MNENSITKNAILNGCRNLLNLIFPLITFPYVSRTLLVEELGQYNFANTFVGYFTMLAALGIETYAVREGAKYRSDPEAFSRFVSQIFSINVVSTALSYLLMFLLTFFSEAFADYRALIVILGLQILFTTIGTEWVYTACEDYTYITVRGIVFRVLSIVLMFVLVRAPGDVLQYAAVITFATVGSGICNALHLRRFCHLHFSVHIDWKRHLPPVLVIFASNIAIWVYVNSDITMLGFLKSDYEVGIYSVSTKIYSIVKGLLSAVLLVTIPRFSQFLGLGKTKEFRSLLARLLAVMSALTLPAITGLFMLSRDVVLCISGEKYLQAQWSLEILCFALLFAMYGWILNSCVLIPAKREKLVLRSSVISAVLNVGLNFIFIPLWAERGAAFTTLLSEALMTVLNTWNARDLLHGLLREYQLPREILTSLLSCAGIVAVCWFCGLHIQSQWIRVAVSVPVSAAVYGGLLLVTGNKAVREMVKMRTGE